MNNEIIVFLEIKICIKLLKFYHSNFLGVRTYTLKYSNSTNKIIKNQIHKMPRSKITI